MGKSLPLEFRRGPMLSVLRTLAESSPEKVADYPELLAVADSEKFQIHELIGLAAKNMAEKDLTGAVRWLADHSSNQELYSAAAAVGDRLGEAVNEGKMTPEQAIAAARTTGDHEPDLLRRIYPELPAAALARLAEDSKSDDGEIVSMVGAWAAKDPVAALRFAGALQNSELIGKIYRDYVTSAADGQSGSVAERTVEALKQIPKAALPSVMYDVLANYPESSNRLSGNLFADTVKSLPESFEKKTILEQLLKQWGGSDPRSAVAWAAEVPDGGWADVVLAAMEGWAKADAWGASQWVNAQPARDNRDAAAQALAASLSDKEPESAWVWALEVRNPNRRFLAIRDALYGFMDRSPGEAGKAFDQVAASLPDSERAELEKILQGPSRPQPAK